VKGRRVPLRKKKVRTGVRNSNPGQIGETTTSPKVPSGKTHAVGERSSIFQEKKKQGGPRVKEKPHIRHSFNKEKMAGHARGQLLGEEAPDGEKFLSRLVQIGEQEKGSPTCPTVTKA